MAYYEQIIPSKRYFFEKSKDLDEIDLKIVWKMAEGCPKGPRNIRDIAQKLELPQQTANYRVSRFEHLNLVRFRAILNEALLGLTNYVVMSTVKPGLLYENKKGAAVNAGTFLACYPVWRVLKDVRGGASHGFFVQYSVPWKKEDDLRLFLDELRNLGCIEKIDDFCRVTRCYSSMPSPSLYLKTRKATARRQTISFNWEKWARDFDKAEETALPEVPVPKRRVSFSYEHLLTLSYLEQNLREKFVNIAKSIGEPSTKVAKWFREILRLRLIDGCKVEIYPIDPIVSMHLVLKLNFTNKVALGKFISRLNEMPYSATYQKVVQENIVFLHVMIPYYEHFDFLNMLETLNRRQDIISSMKIYHSHYYSQFDNVRLFEAFSKKENNWVFSIKIMRKALKRLLDDTKFEF